MKDGATGGRGDGERGQIKGYHDLRVWQNAMDAGMAVFEVTKRFPMEERYSMTDQIRRSRVPSRPTSPRRGESVVTRLPSSRS